ncbi:MAG: translocation/assembly module TamB domain-containing protein [Bacteroidales bacterium]|nr:translocation/assembly module TamB domain-containing protein [Bacteroidales bacterium]
MRQPYRKGTASVYLRPSKDIFEINGDYRISEGNYNFIIPGILSRGFEIQDGSTIRFGGKIPDTQLDINALYKVRASLSSLVMSATDVDTWRLVECGINISDRLSNPQLKFSIDVPDLDPTTKSQIETALATEDKVQKQFLSLLLLGSFLPDETSGVVNGSNILLSNVTELMSSQLNNILSKLEIPLDVGFDYQNATSGNDMFDMAISTQLFNNRVIVGGSVGNRNYSTSANPRGDVVGDLDVQIKLDPEGKYRLNLFSHSADEYSSFLDFSQRNGVGVSFQKEYHTFGELIGNLFRKRNASDQSQEESSSDKEQIIIKIENEQRQTIPDSLSTRR